jgi:hypothetical protein
LKTTLGELEIYGPKGDPDAPAVTTRYTQVPWEVIRAKDREEATKKVRHDQADALAPTGSWQLRGKDELMSKSTTWCLYIDATDVIPKPIPWIMSSEKRARCVLHFPNVARSFVNTIIGTHAESEKRTSRGRPTSKTNSGSNNCSTINTFDICSI